MLDAAFRAAWETGEIPLDLNDEDAIAVKWAVRELMQLPAHYATKTREEQCKITIPGFENQGTADAINRAALWIADLKSGQIYNYREQMAAYCLGLMIEHMESEWTAHLLFCDQQRVVTHRFTLAEAEAIVRAARANVGTPPMPCDYCDWCDKALTCPPRVAAATTALATTDEAFKIILEDPERLGDFLSRCKVFEKFQTAAEDAARQMLADGKPVVGWRLGKPRKSEYVETDDLIKTASDIMPSIIFRAAGTFSARRAKAMFEEAGLEMPKWLVQTKLSTPPLTQI